MICIAYLRHGDYNVVSVDYHPLALEPCYLQAVQNLPTVAKCTAQLLDLLVSMNIFKLDAIHVIGFSLGAQTAGMVANFIKSGKLKRITGNNIQNTIMLGSLMSYIHWAFYIVTV